MIGGGVIGGSTAGNMMAGNPMSGGAPAMSPSLSIPYGKAVNPWAVCHASVGPSKSKKFEDCVREVKSKNHIKS